MLFQSSSFSFTAPFAYFWRYVSLRTAARQCRVGFGVTLCRPLNRPRSIENSGTARHALTCAAPSLPSFFFTGQRKGDRFWLRARARHILWRQPPNLVNDVGRCDNCAVTLSAPITWRPSQHDRRYKFFGFSPIHASQPTIVSGAEPANDVNVPIKNLCSKCPRHGTYLYIGDFLST